MNCRKFWQKPLKEFNELLKNFLKMTVEILFFKFDD